MYRPSERRAETYAGRVGKTTLLFVGQQHTNREMYRQTDRRTAGRRDTKPMLYAFRYARDQRNNWIGMRMVWQRGNLITNDACPTRRKFASTARSRSICHQWRSQKFSTGGASICSIPLKILAHPLGFTRRPITLSTHIPKKLCTFLSEGGAYAPYATCMATPLSVTTDSDSNHACAWRPFDREVTARTKQI